MQQRSVASQALMTSGGSSRRDWKAIYNNKLGDSFFKSASDVITSACDKAGLTYAIKKNVPLVGKIISIAIPNESAPRLLIDITYGITTSSAQTRYAERAESVAAKLRDRNSGKQDKPAYYVYQRS